MLILALKHHVLSSPFFIFSQISKFYSTVVSLYLESFIYILSSFISASGVLSQYAKPSLINYSAFSNINSKWSDVCETESAIIPNT